MGIHKLFKLMYTMCIYGILHTACSLAVVGEWCLIMLATHKIFCSVHSAAAYKDKWESECNLRIIYVSTIRDHFLSLLRFPFIVYTAIWLYEFAHSVLVIYSHSELPKWKASIYRRYYKSYTKTNDINSYWVGVCVCVCMLLCVY